MITPDSSVVVASLGEWHPLHRVARSALEGDDRRLVVHAAYETIAVASRMPEPYRVHPRVVMSAFERDYPDAWLGLDADGQRDVLGSAVAHGLYGGALYDALIAATAARHGATLLSADRRARAAYEAMGAMVTYLAV